MIPFEICSVNSCSCLNVLLLLATIALPLELCSACSPTTSSRDDGQTSSVHVDESQIPSNYRDQVCSGLTLFQRTNRGSREQYFYDYSSSILGDYHPNESTVRVRCTENGQTGQVNAYNPNSRFISQGDEIQATCSAAENEWKINGDAFKRVYCSSGDSNEGRSMPHRSSKLTACCYCQSSPG